MALVNLGYLRQKRIGYGPLNNSGERSRATLALLFSFRIYKKSQKDLY